MYLNGKWQAELEFAVRTALLNNMLHGGHVAEKIVKLLSLGVYKTPSYNDKLHQLVNYYVSYKDGEAYMTPADKRRFTRTKRRNKKA